MQFLFQPLTWGFLLVGVPILVHLINMLRHRKQKWAAMDFLLESYRRNRRWVMLKQWLLLAARMLAMVLLVAMLAKWVSASKWLGWFGGQTTHHYILLDDSFSMAEVDQNESAYARGLRALGGLVRSIAGEPGQHQISLLRWSRATIASQGDAENIRLDAAADLIAQTVPRDPARLLDRLNATQPTALQLAPRAALDIVAPMVAENAEEHAEVYLISDLRRNEFGEPEELRSRLRALVDNSAGIHLIDCAKDLTTNLSVASVEPEQEVWAAGVPLMVRFQVRNQTGQPATNVVVRLRAVRYGEGAVAPQADKPYSGEILDLPPVVIEQIGAGETVTRQVQVIFGVPGHHVVEVAIPDDALAVDNRRWCVIGIKQSQRVLLVDGDIQQTNAFYFETVINPAAGLQTGMSLEKADASYLRDTSPEALAAEDVIVLLDVPRLDAQAIAKLEDYCRSGGGLLIVGGRNTNLEFVNEQLYRDGEGIFPVALSSIDEYPQVIGNTEPQVAASDHPVLMPLTQLSSSPFLQLRIGRLLAAEPESLQQPGLQWVATGPERKPLILDRGFGKGRVLVILTGLTSDWSNWAQDPTFVVMALRSLGYLGSFRRAPTSESVGSPIEMVVTGQTVLPDADLLLPARDDASRIRLQRQVEESEQGDVSRLSVGIDLEQMDRDLVDGLLRPGLFEAWMVSGQGEQIVQNFAHNVAAAEGDLSRVTHNELQQKMPDIPLRIRTADAVSGTGLNSQNAAHSTLLMYLLAALLLGEQALAYSASYHTQRLAGGGR